MNSFKICILFFAIALFSSCASTQMSTEQIMNSWIGSHKSQIIQSWGPPMGGTTSDGNGGEILMYTDSRQLIMPPIGNGPIMGKTITDYQYVYCRADGTIYYIKWGRQ